MQNELRIMRMTTPPVKMMVKMMANLTITLGAAKAGIYRGNTFIQILLIQYRCFRKL